MTRRLLGPVSGPIAFFLVGALIFGVLGWVTHAALRVEQAQREAAARAKLSDNLRVALGQLDSRMLPALGVEDNRPYYHYDPPAGFGPASPLLTAPLPEWMRLHFQVASTAEWTSPQVLSAEQAEQIRVVWPEIPWRNLNGPRRDYLDTQLKAKFPFRATCETFAARDQAIPTNSLPFAAPLFTEVITPAVEEPPAEPAAARHPADSTPKPPPPQDPVSNTGPDPATDTVRVLGFELCLRHDAPAPGDNPRADLEAAAQKKAGGPASQDAPPPRPVAPAQFAGNNSASRGVRMSQKDADNDRLRNDYLSRAETIDKAMKEAKQAGQADPLPARAPFFPMYQNFAPPSLPLDQRGMTQQQLLALNQSPKADASNSAPPAVPGPAAPGAAAPVLPTGPDVGKADGKDARELAERAKHEAEHLRAAKAAEARNQKSEEAASWFGWFGGAWQPLDDPARRGTDDKRKGSAADEKAAPKPGPTAPAPPGEDHPVPTVAPVVAPAQPVAIHLGSMRPQWVTAPDGSEMLVLVRTATLKILVGKSEVEKVVYQGVVLDWPKLEAELKDRVKDLFPDARLVPVKDPEGVSADRAMIVLPVQLDPGPEPPLPPAGWTPLRLGLLLAWVAAVVAFIAVGFSGWSLIDLAERRIRFVSAVTHELRTPLTSLRLYLDLLVSGMIQDEAKRQEYLNTLAAESDRLHRLIDNVLDFARLEKRRKNGDIKPGKVADLVEQVRQTWADRAAQDGKELVVVSTLPADREVRTDAAMILQIVGNLIDNARKYTRDAADPRIWLWARPGPGNAVVLEVEDRGPGVPANERRSIFKPFSRGQHADSTAGGAGLGLALAKSWAEVLGAKLTYRPADGGVGACFRLELPGK